MWLLIVLMNYTWRNHNSWGVRQCWVQPCDCMDQAPAPLWSWFHLDGIILAGQKAWLLLTGWLLQLQPRCKSLSGGYSVVNLMYSFYKLVKLHLDWRKCCWPKRPHPVKHKSSKSLGIWKGTEAKHYRQHFLKFLRGKILLAAFAEDSSSDFSFETHKARPCHIKSNRPS